MVKRPILQVRPKIREVFVHSKTTRLTIYRGAAYFNLAGLAAG